MQCSNRKSIDSTEARITLNLGVFNLRVAQDSSPKSYDSSPAFLDCHVKFRLGDFFTPPSDIWWNVGVSSDCDREVGQEISSVLVQRALPFTETLAADETLRDFWLSGAAPGLTDFERLMSLASLVTHIGPAACLMNIADELDQKFIGRAVENRARQRAAELRNHFRGVSE